MIAEEASSRDGVRKDAPKTFLLVDPLDGTREFLARNGEFTVNVGLVDDGAPILGCVFAPALGKMWIGSTGLGAKAAQAGLRQIADADAYKTDRGAPRSRRRALRGREPQPFRPGDRGVPVRPRGREPALGGLVAEVLPGGGGRGRRLSALRPDHGMGHRRRPRRAVRRRRRAC